MQINFFRLLMKKRKTPSTKDETPQSSPTNLLEQEVLATFEANPKKAFSTKQISKKTMQANALEIQEAMVSLAKTGKITPVNEYKYRLNIKEAVPPKGKKEKTCEGIVDMTRSGAAYIIVEGSPDDVFVPANKMNTALAGDRVEVRLTPAGRGRRSEGSIIQVLERATSHFIGTIHISPKFAFVVTDKANMRVDIFIPKAETKSAKHGDKVVVEVVEWPSEKNRSPVGRVTSVLGASGNSDIEMKSILINNGFKLEFPKAAMRQAESLSTEIEAEEIALRRDMRTITTFTIDPEDAKDFDDALSIEYLENGDLEVGVHIADVSHYVKPDTELDKEALDRSTSVYLVDRVLPMLPEKLSNELCSLRPHEDKLTFSAVFTFNKQSKISKRWFGKTAIHSDRRFSYEEAQEVLETGKGDFAQELKKLNELAYFLREQRFKEGAISFEAEEVRFKLAEDGTPLSVYVKERKDAHLLIEDFMLLANKEVATFIVNKGKRLGREIPFVYRVHDAPDQTKLEDFARFAAEFGVKMNLSTPKNISKSFNQLAKLCVERSELKLLEPLAIRTMAKAAYTTQNIGHYGLAFENYSHFTSPIRRYSDVLAHRLLEKNLHNAYRTDKEVLETKCRHISAQERRAMTAERESVKYKQVEFVEKHVGETFDGIVSGMMERGMFVELLGSKCEGMVPFSTIDEPIVMDESRLQARGKFSGDTYKMGDRLRVRIVNTDLAKRQIDMELATD
jgi:ribonuclease R